MKSQKRILTLLISGASLLPLALHAFECTPLKEDAAPINFPGTSPSIQLIPISTCRVGLYNTKGSEIVAYDPRTKRLFVVNQAQAPEKEGDPLTPTLDVIDIRNPYSPDHLGSIDLSGIFGSTTTVIPTSVAIKNGIVAVAVHPDPDPGSVVGNVLFYNAGLTLPNHGEIQEIDPIKIVVGYTPDMLTFTPNGQMILVANTGFLPTDKGGSVSLIDIRPSIEQAKVNTIPISSFTGNLPKGVRIYGNLNSLQPEYIAVANNSLKAWVSLEVNNAVAVLDIKKGQITDILPLGVKDHNLTNSGFVSWDWDGSIPCSDIGGKCSSNGFDPSDKDCPIPLTCENPVKNKDGKINVATWPVYGMYQPDAMEAYQTHGQTYLVTANEGAWFFEDERVRVSKLKLDEKAFPNYIDLQKSSQLGNLRVTKLQGDEDGDSDYEKLYAFSTRSFSIWSENGGLVFDSGDDFERITAQTLWFDDDPNDIFGPLSYFNCEDSSNEFDGKSDDQGVQPDGLTIGKLYGRYYVFVVLQRVGGIMVYDITDPQQPRFQQYINNRNFGIDPKIDCPDSKKGLPDFDPLKEEKQCKEAGDLGPEGVLFISEADSGTGVPLLVVANQTSSSTTVYRIERILPPPR